MVDADAILNAAAGEIDAAAFRCMEDFKRLVAGGMTEAEAIRIAQRVFERNATAAITGAFSRLLSTQVQASAVLAMTVGEVTLSRALHQNSTAVQREVRRIVQQTVRDKVNVQELARRLWDGYATPKGVEVLSPAARPLRKELQALMRLSMSDPALRQKVEALQRQIGSIRTAGLRSSYEQAFRLALEGASEQRRDKALWQAIQERNRYWANRIAQTEVARAHADRVADELLADDSIEVVEWRMAATHPVVDICDLLAGQDAFGLGPGLYPKLRAPKPIAHPHCRCRLVSRPDVSAAGARAHPAAARTFLRGHSISTAARMVGSRAKLAEVLKGADPIDLANAGRPAGYKIVTLGKKGRSAGPVIGGAPVVPPVAPVPVAPVAAAFDTSTEAGRWHVASWADDAPEWLMRHVRREQAIPVTRLDKDPVTGRELTGFYSWIGEINMPTRYAVTGGRSRSTWRHEFGHRLDHLLARGKPHPHMTLSQGDRFTNAMYDDAKALRSRVFGQSAWSDFDHHVWKDYRAAYIAEETSAPALAEAVLEQRAKKLGLTLRELRAMVAMESEAVIDGTLQGRARMARLLRAIEIGDPEGFVREASGQLFGVYGPGEYQSVYRTFDQKGMLGKVSDLFGAATKNVVCSNDKMPGHSSSYYSMSGYRQMEAWANIVAIAGGPNSTLARIVRQMAPRMFAVTEELLNGAWQP